MINFPALNNGGVGRNSNEVNVWKPNPTPPVSNPMIFPTVNSLSLTHTQYIRRERDRDCHLPVAVSEEYRQYTHDNANSIRTHNHFSHNAKLPASAFLCCAHIVLMSLFHFLFVLTRSLLLTNSPPHTTHFRFFTPTSHFILFFIVSVGKMKLSSSFL